MIASRLATASSVQTILNYSPTRGRGSGAAEPRDDSQRLTASWLINRPSRTSASARALASASAADSGVSNGTVSCVMHRIVQDPRSDDESPPQHQGDRFPPP